MWPPSREIRGTVSHVFINHIVIEATGEISEATVIVVLGCHNNLMGTLSLSASASEFRSLQSLTCIASQSIWSLTLRACS